MRVDTANVRAGPGPNHPVRFTADWGDAFLVRDRKGRWLEVEAADDDRGWIRTDLVRGDVD